MKAWWQLFPSAVTPAECANLVKAGLEMIPSPATVGHGGSPGVNKNIRVSETAWFQRWDPRFMPLFHRLHLMGKQANAWAFGLDLDDFYEIQFTVYDSKNQGHYHKHIDNCWKPAPGKDERMYERKMSMVLQLSAPDSYTGGRLELDEDPLPEGMFTGQGDVIFFPSWNPHAVTPVTDGIRYSLVAWFMGPKVR